MIPVLDAKSIRSADAYTIENEPITSVDLMERASYAFVAQFARVIPEGKFMVVFAGTGNNGGDALAIARILKGMGHQISVYIVGSPERGSDDFKANLRKLEDFAAIGIIAGEEQIPIIDPDAIVIDGLFGSGLSRPVEGLFATVIESINGSGVTVVSIDIPSGLFANQLPSYGAVIRAGYTITFQLPKLTFFLPSCALFVGKWYVVDIGLSPSFIRSCETDYHYTAQEDIKLPGRSTFDHKGTAGRLLLVSGSKGKMGATTLSARAAMRSGCGLLYIHAPCCGMDILQINVPEAMVISDEHTEVVSEVMPAEDIDAVAIGPGLGMNSLTQRAVEQLILNSQRPIVLDADALNILAANSYLLDSLPEQSILTPHPGEFKRLVGEWEDDLEKLDLLKAFCKRYRVNVVLKGAFSAVCDVSGNIYFNPTGNPGMATAGSGDVLTGIIAALLTQGLFPFDALRTGVYLHGLAGDLAATEVGEVPLIASDLIHFLPNAFKQLLNSGV